MRVGPEVGRMDLLVNGSRTGPERSGSSQALRLGCSSRLVGAVRPPFLNGQLRAARQEEGLHAPCSGQHATSGKVDLGSENVDHMKVTLCGAPRKGARV